MKKQDEDKRLAFETVYDQGRAMIIVSLQEVKLSLPPVAREASPNGRHLGLNYSRRFADANIKIQDDGISAYLSFKGHRHPTFVPWSAIRAIVVGTQIMESWENEPDEEILVEVTPGIDTDGMTAEEMKWFSKQVAEG